MSKIAPCLWFDTEAEAAANHYVQTYRQMGHEAAIGAVTHYGPEGPGPVGGVLTVWFRLCGQDFMAVNGGPQFPHTPAMSLMVKCADQAEIDGFWDRLSAGGASGQCGWLTDRFGVSWQVVPESLETIMGEGDKAKSSRVMAKVLTMTKLDLAVLERAAAG